LLFHIRDSSQIVTAMVLVRPRLPRICAVCMALASLLLLAAPWSLAFGQSFQGQSCSRARGSGSAKVTAFAREDGKSLSSIVDFNPSEVDFFRVSRKLAGLAPQVSSIVVTSMVLLGVLSGGSSGDQGATQVRDWNTKVQISISKDRGSNADGTAWYRTVTTSVRETRTGAPMEELSRLVRSLESSTDQAELSERLLDELQATDSPARAGRLESLLWQTWYFHEDEAARQLLRDGSDLLAEGDLNEAKKRFLHAAILEPGWAEAWNRLATVNYLLGFYDESLAEIDKTLEIVPRHFGALSGRGLVMLKLERYREAVEAFEDTQEVCPTSRSATSNKAFAEALQEKSLRP